MFFAVGGDGSAADVYDTMLAAVRFADRAPFCAVWTPERHFHEFGGHFPNPAVTSAALAVVTSHLQIRAGSLVSPLHNTVRLAEDWAVVDNLSRGRAAISFGSGWNARDFVLWPERYEHRRELMYEQIATLRSLWSGESLVLCDSFGHEVPVRLFPRPVQAELPIWVTASASPETFRRAGQIGANVLTHLAFQDHDALRERVAIYRAARRSAGLDPDAGLVSLMLHTYVDDDPARAHAVARGPLLRYLSSAIELELHAARSGGAVSGGRRLSAGDVSAESVAELADASCDRYLATDSLIGSVAHCEAVVDRMRGLGVDEIACLLDFGIPASPMLDGVRRLAAVARAVHSETAGSR